MDESKAIAQVIAAYEKLTRQNSRIKALEKKLADGTISLKEAAELNSLRARAFGRALSGKVLDIALGEREGTCTALLREGCNYTDELAQTAQRAVLARQGLNLTPPTADFEEERARKIGHSLEDTTVPDETIQRRARSATENMLNSQYDRNMKKGAETCASAGLKTYIVRDSGSGCCKWCNEVSGKFAYGTEPKDVYRRHDNCTCTVTYESGRGRQNVWSKQYWSQEQEREYLRLRDEMAPKRLSARQAQALRDQVGGLTNFASGGTINAIHAIGDSSGQPYDTEFNYEPKVTASVRKAFEDEYQTAVSKFGKISTILGVDVLTDKSTDEGNYSNFSRHIALRHAEKKNGLQTMATIAAQKYKAGKWSTGHPRHAMRHEIAHALQLERRISDPNWNDKFERIKDIFIKAASKSDGYDLPSEYSGKTIEEFISECVAAGYSKKQSRTVREVCAIINEVTEQ